MQFLLYLERSYIILSKNKDRIITSYAPMAFFSCKESIARATLLAVPGTVFITNMGSGTACPKYFSLQWLQYVRQ